MALTCAGPEILLGIDGLRRARSLNGEISERAASAAFRVAMPGIRQRATPETCPGTARGLKGAIEFEDDATLVVVKLDFDHPPKTTAAAS